MHCCKTIKNYLTLDCEIHSNIFDCPDVLIQYIDKFDEYGLIVHDGGTSSITIQFCPFCGKKLPESKRDLWFLTLEKLGFDDPNEQRIPKKFNSNQWYT